MSKIPCKTYQPGSGGKFRYAHAKLDGHYVEIVKHERIIVFSSSGRDITDSVRYCAWLPWLGKVLPEAHRIAGEIWVPGGTSTDVGSAIANEQLLMFSGFASFSHAESTPLHELQDFFTKQLDVGFAPYIRIVPTTECVDGVKDGNCMMATAADEVIDIHLHGGRLAAVYAEGLVFKDGNLLNWSKWKPSYTCDCVITGYTPGVGKYRGLIGSIALSLYNEAKELVQVANVSGMDDEVRRNITSSWPSHKGCVVEIEYQFGYADGRLRHPRFKQFRPEKRPSDCGFDQIVVRK